METDTDNEKGTQHIWSSGVQRLFEGQGQKEKKGTYSMFRHWRGHFSAHFGSQEGTLVHVFANQEGTLARVLAPKRAL